MDSILALDIPYIPYFSIPTSSAINLRFLSRHGVPQERRRTVNPLRGKTEFLANKNIKVNTNGGKQEGISKKEYPGIANNKRDPNGR